MEKNQVYEKKKRIRCYICNAPHLSYNCSNEMDYENKRIGWIFAKDNKGSNSGNGENELPMIDLLHNNRNVRNINYSGAQTAVFYAKVNPWRAKRAGKVFLVPIVK